MRHKFTILATFCLLSLGLAFAQETGKQTQQPSSAADSAKRAADSKGGPATDSLDGTSKPTQGLGAPAKKTKQKSDAAPKRSPTEQILDAAIEKVRALTTFSTDLRQTVEMLGHKFHGTGKYAVGTGHRMRFEVTVKLTDTTGTLLEVSDGSKHWRSRHILDVRELTRVDMTRVRAIVDKPEFDTNIRGQLDRQLGFSGMLPLIEGVRDNLVFQSHEQAELGGKPVFVLKGIWKDGLLPPAKPTATPPPSASVGPAQPRDARSASESASSTTPTSGTAATPASAPVSSAPAGGPTAPAAKSAPPPSSSPFDVPDYVAVAAALWIDRETGWPYRVVLESAKDAKGPRTIITMEFDNPQIGGELPATLFVFEAPKDVEVTDETDRICQQLTVALQAMQDRERMGTAPPAAPGTAAPAGRPNSAPTGSGSSPNSAVSPTPANPAIPK